MPVMDADQRRKLEDSLLRKAEEAVRRLRHEAESGDPTRVDSLAEGMAGLLKTREFPSVRAAEFREITRAIQRGAYQRSVDSLLVQAERCGHHGDEKGRNALLTQAKDHFAKALRFGADDEFRHGVERRVQAALMTSKDGVDDRTKEASRRKLEQHDVGAKPPNGIERRRSIRYMDPVLQVDAEGRRCTTINWSTRGLLVDLPPEEFSHAMGGKLRLELHCPEVPGVGGRQIAHVVRVDPDRHGVALSFPDISTVILDLMHAMKDAGIKPEPER
ncbi:PilZ domain-containing protein [Azospirillum sp. TSO35-2]|uniref:PilZ domain-containing protein n=1 Tax=Azospirillum sp. TSO35-2 TaxID=716796 RepID=UPI0011B6E0E6|nr:PilZ domain-containing protein [Azospirillum sp. TSO35-2]